MKKIEINYWMSFYSSFIGKQIISPKTHNFIIDFEKNMIIPQDQTDCIDLDYMVSENILTDEIDLDTDKLNDFLHDFEKLEFNESNKFFTSDSTFFNIVNVVDSDKSNVYLLDGMQWSYLGEILENLVGFDILNIRNVKYIITDLDYDIRRDGVYDKSTKRRLKLKSLNYWRKSVFDSMHFPQFIIDFENEKIDGEDASSATLNLILDLLRKHHIWELDDKRYWSDALSQRKWVQDGFNWRLSLLFEDNIHWHIGYSNDYPDAFVRFAREFKQLTGTDLEVFEK